jgi:predicted acyl esterase
MRRFLLVLTTLIAALAVATAPAMSAGTPVKKKDTRSKACKQAKTKKQKAKHCKKDTRSKACKKAKTKKQKARHCKKKKKVKPGKPGTPAPPKRPTLEPFDYTANPGLSEAKYSDKEIERTPLQLKMADGATVYLEIIKPKGADKLGVILEASGYHGTLYGRTGTRILPLPLDKSRNPVGLTGYFPHRGYAVVMMDLRGTGKSQGCLDHLGPNDQSDLKTVIEWAATQPWSNGRVGMVGHSYVGSTPIIATKLNPKGLVTIVPSAGLGSIYDHQYQAGVAWNAQLIGPIEAYAGLATAADLPAGLPLDAALGGPTGDNFGADRPQDTGCQYTQTGLNAGPPSVLLGTETAWHQARDATKEAIAWPGHVFLVHGVNDQAARIASAWWFHQRTVKPGDKLFIGQWDHGIGCCPNQRGMQWTEALHAWFDRQLLQRDVDTGPPVEAYLNDKTTVPAAIPARQEIATSATWPATAKTVVAGAGGDGSLVLGGAGPEGNQSFTGDPRGYNSGYDGTGGVDFTSEPVKQDMLLVGVPKLDLVASTLTQRVDLILNVLSQSPTGDRRRITHCAMNPLVRNGLATPTPVVPGQAMELKPPCWAMAHKLKAGSRLVLRFTASDPDHIPLGIGDPQITIEGGANGTKLTLPLVEGATLYKDTFPVGAKPNGAGVGG